MLNNQLLNDLPKTKHQLPASQLRAHAAGFTLIELLMVLIIAGILMSIAVPNMRTTAQNAQMNGNYSDLVGMFSQARTEAVTRNAPVAICPSTDGATCSGAALYETGWIMFVDDGAGGGNASNRVLDGTEELLRVGEAMPGANGSFTLRQHGNYLTSQTGVLIEANGMAEEVGTWVLCDERGASDLRALNVSIAGQSRPALDTNADGARNAINATFNAAGAELTSCPI